VVQAAVEPAEDGEALADERRVLRVTRFARELIESALGDAVDRLGGAADQIDRAVGGEDERLEVGRGACMMPAPGAPSIGPERVRDIRGGVVRAGIEDRLGAVDREDAVARADDEGALAADDRDEKAEEEEIVDGAAPRVRVGAEAVEDATEIGEECVLDPTCG